MNMALSIGLISLIIFGNIENLILASQGVVKAANPLKLAIFSLICVTCWLIIGTVCTQQLEAYGIYIEFIGGLAIFILGIQAMLESIPGISDIAGTDAYATIINVVPQMILNIVLFVVVLHYINRMRGI